MTRSWRPYLRNSASPTRRSSGSSTDRIAIYWSEPSGSAPMPEDRPRTPRTLLIPDHLWDAMAAMASEMGADRDALVNQALYTFARLNGFLVPSDLRRPAGDEAERAPGGH